MNHYQVNLRSIACRAPRNPLELLREVREPAAACVSPLAALTEELELIAGLGVELLHVMPPFLMGREARKGIGSPYAVADAGEIDPEFGTRGEWFALVRRAHALGMKVIMGYVPNHTARDHVWIKKDPRFHVRGAGGSALYDFDWSDTAKLDYTYGPLRREVTETLCAWIRGEGGESGVDGFRMDMAHMVNDLSFWDECIPRLHEAMGERELILLAECYGFERNVDLFRRGFQAAYDDDFYKILQYAYARDEGGRSRLLPDPAAEKNGDFAPRLADWRRGGIAAAVTGLISAYQAQAPGKKLARYVDNHDEGRGIYRFGVEACRVWMDMAACLPDTILFTLAGQEGGAWNRPPIHEYGSVCDKGYRRAGGGTVEGLEFEGNLFFRSSEARREAVSEARKRFALRRDHPAVGEGAWEVLDVGEVAADTEKSVVAFRRRARGETLYGLFNLGHEARELRKPPAGAGLYGNVGSTFLPAFSSQIFLV